MGITKIQAYTTTPNADTLTLAEPGRAATDPLQIVDIQGLEPVKATINTTPLAAADGENIDGSQVPSRNIILIVRPNPDWSTWSPEALRRLLYYYFNPKSKIRLVFTSDDIDPVFIEGIVDSCGDTPFSNDPSFTVSIICKYPYFKSVTDEVITGTAIVTGGTFVTVTNDGDVFAPFKLTVDYGGTPPNIIQVSILAPQWKDFIINPNLDQSGPVGDLFMMSSVPTEKYARVVTTNNGLLYYVTSGIQEEVDWPVLSPGDNIFAVITDSGGQDWELHVPKTYAGF